MVAGILLPQFGRGRGHVGCKLIDPELRVRAVIRVSWITADVALGVHRHLVPSGLQRVANAGDEADLGRLIVGVVRP